MCYANEIGLDKALGIIQGFQQQLGDRYWKPSLLLEKLVNAREKFE